MSRRELDAVVAHGLILMRQRFEQNVTVLAVATASLGLALANFVQLIRSETGALLVLVLITAMLSLGFRYGVARWQWQAGQQIARDPDTAAPWISGLAKSARAQGRPLPDAALREIAIKTGYNLEWVRHFARADLPMEHGYEVPRA